MNVIPRVKLRLASIAAIFLLVAVSSRAADPELYATTESGYVGVLDPLTGSFSVIGQSSMIASLQVAGIGFAANGNLYGFGVGAGGNSQLLLINTNNGAATFVGTGLPRGSGGWGMTATPNGTLYAYLQPNGGITSLYTVNPTNGAETVVGSMGVVVAGAFAGDESGSLFITPGTGTEKLYGVNPSTGAATLIGNTGSGNAFAMAFYGSTLYLVDLNGAIWTVNTTTGAATKISNYDNSKGAIYALASFYFTPGPAPVIQAFSQIDEFVSITWSVVAGSTYQLQYSPDLSPGSWLNLGAPVVVSGTTWTAADPISPNSQRFYRVALLP